MYFLPSRGQASVLGRAGICSREGGHLFSGGPTLDVPRAFFMLLSGTLCRRDESTPKGHGKNIWATRGLPLAAQMGLMY